MRVLELQPPQAIDIPAIEPIVFLNGPIQGAPNWQRDAISIVEGMSVDIDVLHALNPRRNISITKAEINYVEQVKWESIGRDKANMLGGHLFWFAAQDPNEPYEKDRAYAQTSRVELGETFGEIKAGKKINVVLGFDPNYQGGSERYMRFKADERGILVVDSLEIACESLVKTIESQL